MQTILHHPRIGRTEEISPMEFLILQGLFLLIVTIALYAYASGI